MPTMDEVMAENEKLKSGATLAEYTDRALTAEARAERAEVRLERLREDLAIARRATEICRQENLKLHRRLSDQSVAHGLDRSQRLTEGMEMVWTDPTRMGGQPCIRDTRIPVAQVLDMLAGGDSINSIGEDFPHIKPMLRPLLLELANRL